MILKNWENNLVSHSTKKVNAYKMSDPLWEGTNKGHEQEQDKDAFLTTKR